MEVARGNELELRQQAISRIRRKRGFRVHVRVYVAVNLILVGIWAVTGGFFWPIFPMLGWGIGVSANAWGVYGRRKPIDDAEIRREMEQLQSGSLP
jgi:hypothetical protein